MQPTSGKAKDKKLATCRSYAKLNRLTIKRLAPARDIWGGVLAALVAGILQVSRKGNFLCCASYSASPV
ncbi:MAG: hypothetical protein CRN43_19075 [Candidatus Nephrothrix sp. EaCA]|nr:MAG: hypothetical protein CRN43_19075 [Candidatus Nephrothrix sp. EaCA]